MDAKVLSHGDILEKMPERAVSSHKGNYGRILLLCGSRGYTGAAALSAMGALRAGAGLVYLGVPECIYAIEAMKLSEPIVIPLPGRNGVLSRKSVRKIDQLLPQMDAVLIGPGLGCTTDTLSVTKHILSVFSGPVVLDADGINLISSHKNVLRDRTSPTILTPHEGEFSRLGGDQNLPRQEGTEYLARDLGAIIVRKGHNTVITDGEFTYINPTGNPGMAVGGSGDVLAGMVVSLIGQKIKPLDAAACATWLHGAAGDICAKEIGQYGMLPSDLLQVLPRLMK